MAVYKPTMMEPPVEGLLDKVDSKFTLVTLAAKRSRQINSYFNQLGEGLGAIVPPQVASVSRKPLSIALEEISAGKIRYIQAAEVEGVEGEGVAIEDKGLSGDDKGVSAEAAGVAGGAADSEGIVAAAEAEAAEAMAEAPAP